MNSHYEALLYITWEKSDIKSSLWVRCLWISKNQTAYFPEPSLFLPQNRFLEVKQAC